jgi:FYVE zinc finger
VDKLNLETSRLEKRLTKLTQILAVSPPPIDSGAGGLLWGFGGGAKSQQRTLEQSVIDWEDDTKVPKCPFCQQEFSSYTFRRHHCRLCGRVICGDPQTQCSSLVGLNVIAGTFPLGSLNIYLAQTNRTQKRARTMSVLTYECAKTASIRSSAKLIMTKKSTGNRQTNEHTRI